MKTKRLVRNAKTSLVNGVSKTFGVAHFVVQTSADLLVEAEASTVRMISKDYTRKEIREARYSSTISAQIKTIETCLVAKHRIKERFRREPKVEIINSPA